MIVACMVKHRSLLSKQSTLPTDESGLSANDPTTATSPILKQSELLTNKSGLPANDPTAATSPTLEQSELLTNKSGLPANNPTAATSPTLEQSELLTNKSGLPANDPTAATSPILEQSELLTDNPHNQKATIVPVHDQATKVASLSYDTPTTPSTVPKSPAQPLPIKVFPEMALSVQVKRGSREWHISGVADWAIGYGDRAELEDGTVLLAVKAKRKPFLFQAEAQLLAYLATIRQLRIQANKKNVMAQGFYSDGENYRFLCIRNNGTVMRSAPYDVTVHPKYLKTVFNFLLSMLSTAAKSSPNTSPTKPGTEQDERIEHFDQEVFVEVFEDIGADNISIPRVFYGEVEELPDIIPEQD